MAGKRLSLLVHFIWSTAGREPWIGNDWREPLYAYVGGVIRNKNGHLLAAGGMYDHIHLYASPPSTISITNFVQAVKSNSSRWVHETFPNRRAFGWQEGYGAFSVSKHKNRMSSPISIVKNSTIKNVRSKRNTLGFFTDTTLNMMCGFASKVFACIDVGSFHSHLASPRCHELSFSRETV